MDRHALMGWWAKRGDNSDMVRTSRLAVLRDEALTLFYQRYSEVGLGQVRWQLNDAQIRSGHSGPRMVGRPRPSAVSAVSRHWLIDTEPEDTGVASTSGRLSH